MYILIFLYQLCEGFLEASGENKRVCIQNQEPSLYKLQTTVSYYKVGYPSRSF